MSTIIQSQRPVDPTPRRGTDGAAPGMLEGIGLQIGLVQDDMSWKEIQLLDDGYKDLKQSLVDVGVDAATLEPELVTTPQYGITSIEDFQRTRRDLLWKRLSEARRRDPASFKSLPATQDEYEKWLLNRRGQRQLDQERFARAPTGSGIIGGVIGGLTDPVNLATLPFGGGGKTILQAAGREALTNMIVEGIQQPMIAGIRERRGEDFTGGEAATNVLFAGLGGGAIGGIAKGVEIGAPKVVGAGRAKVEALITEHWDALPEAVRARWAKGTTIADAELPDLAEAIIGRGNMTADERALIANARRDAQIESTSPFKPGLTGDIAHRVRLDQSLAALLQPVERQARAFTTPARPELMSGSSLSTGAPVSGARAQVKAKIARAESGGTANPDIAKNPRSSATGKYQFVSGTWLRYYKRRFGDQGLSDAQILAKRSDGRIQDALMDDLTADNAAFLRAVGEAETAGNLYLAHFAGQGGARKLFAADPSARAVDVLGEGVALANPWLRKMSAGDVIAWAHRKMNEPAPRRAGARAELAEGEGLYREQLQREIDRLDAESDAARAARAADDPLADAVASIAARDVSIDNELVPVDVDDIDLPELAPFIADAAAIGLPDRSAALVPILRSEIDSRGVIDVADLSRRLDASEDEIRDIAARVTANEPPPPLGADGAPLVPDRKAQATIATEVRRALKAEGWKIDGDQATKEFDNMGESGAMASGRRVVTLRVDKTGGVLERIDGGKVGVSVALPRFGDDVRGAVRASLGGMRREAGDLFEGRAVRRPELPTAPARIKEGAALTGWDSPDDAAAVALADSVWHDLDALAEAAGDAGKMAPVQIDDGAQRTWADVADEINDDAAAVAAVKACL